MAFGKANGYTNLNNGNFSPVIYSKKVQLSFRKTTVVGDISNSDYFGEISGQGDTVRIMKEPEISVSALLRGTSISTQDLVDTDFQLVVDKSNYFAFKLDDIEEAHSHINFMQLAVDRAAYRLADQYDQEVLGYLAGYKQSALHANAAAVNDQVNGTKADTAAGSDELLAGHKLKKGDFGNITTSSAGDHAIPLAARLPGATALPTATASPAMVVARMARILDQKQVDKDGRWIVVDPVFMEILRDEDSRFMNADFRRCNLHPYGSRTNYLSPYILECNNRSQGRYPSEFGMSSNQKFYKIQAIHTHFDLQLRLECAQPR